MASVYPEHIAIVSNELAIAWSDGKESFLPAALLREQSPSAENIGESDLLGRRSGASPAQNLATVLLLDWQIVGGYALQLRFSDGHSSGIFSYALLRALAEQQNNSPE